MQRDKVILVDCDGVLLDWEYAFDVWMRHHGHTIKQKGDYEVSVRYGIDNAKQIIRIFNESAAIGFLPPLRDAIHYVKKLHEEHGYVFHAITSLSNDPNAQKLRTINLQRLFGETAFEKFVYLDTGADKDEALKPYEGSECWWIEDKPANAQVGIKYGLSSILMAHAHNIEFYSQYSRAMMFTENNSKYRMQRVENWREIYSYITGI